MTRLILECALAAIVLAAIIATAVQARFLSILRENHPEQWRKLGSPALFKSGSMGNSSAVQQFIKEEKFAGLNDERLSKAAAMLKLANRLYSAVFIIGIALFVWNIYFLPHLKNR
ncbi:MAG TPA: hypothetical protein VNH15_04275 [Elusimicrobiota bacterium]|nr:hypothetical protein [Elusimicrobiota bacterium]